MPMVGQVDRCEDHRVAIDRSGQWWTGDDPSDLDEYVIAFSAENYPAGTVVHAVCASCSSTDFSSRARLRGGLRRPHLCLVQ